MQKVTRLKVSTPLSKTGVNLTENMAKNTGNQVIVSGLDWFQVCCKFKGQIQWIKQDDFEVIIESERTQHFLTIAKVFYKGIYFLNICYNPASSILPQNMCLIKVINECLYLDWWKLKMCSFIDEQNLLFNNITRFDVCLDFNKFIALNNPEKLIGGFLARKFLKSSKGKFKVMGDNCNDMNFQYIRFGSQSSEISTYLYNKSIELREVNSKPYIVDKWVRGGLNMDKDIWRLEFSLKLPKIELITEDGELLARIKYIEDFTQENLNILITYLIDKNFKFYKNQQASRKDRNEELILFNLDYNKVKRLRVYTKLDGFKSDKLFINKILKNDHELRTKRPFLAHRLNAIVEDFADSKGLNEYLDSKRAFYDVKRNNKENYSDDEPLN